MNAPAIDRAQKTGRRIGTALFALLIGSFTIVCSVQVLTQGFSSQSGASTQVNVECREGLRSLVTALSDARSRVALANPEERARLMHFRDILGRTWKSRNEIEKRCKSDAWAIQALEQIDELRWAEEHAVRYESANLAPSRQQVAGIEKVLADSNSTKP